MVINRFESCPDYKNLNTMRKQEIKKIMVVHNDNDFVCVWEWIGNITLITLKTKNACGEEMLEESEDIEKFIHSLLPTAIEFTQYKISKYEDYSRYRNIEEIELNRLVSYFKNIRFKYNFDESDDDWVLGGSETLIIDLEKNESYIR
jgi:hypothetical protein